MRNDVFQNHSVSVTQFAFQACAFNDSAISPSRVPTKGQERPTSVTARTSRGRDRVGASIRGARISVMAATRLGHGSGVESCVGGLLSARLTEVPSGGRSSCNVFQSVSRSTRSY